MLRLRPARRRAAAIRVTDNLAAAAGGGSDPQDCACLRAGDSERESASEGGQEGREEFAKYRAEFVVCLGASPDRVLMSAGQHRDCLTQFSVGRKSAMQVSVDAQDIGQGHRVSVIGLRPCHRVTLPIPGERERVDRIHRPPRCTHRGHQQASGCFDRHRNRFVVALAGGGQRLDQLGEPAGIVSNAFLGNELPVAVDDGDIVVGSAQSMPQNSFMVSFPPVTDT
jgi:hypothetical protein